MAPRKPTRKTVKPAKNVARKAAKVPAKKVAPARGKKASPAKPAPVRMVGPKVVPVSSQTVPMAYAQLADMGRVNGYRGNVPMQHFIGWVMLIVLGALAVGFLLSQVLVGQRQAQLVEDTATRVAMQGQARAQVISQWLQGVEGVVDAVAQTQLVRLYVAELGSGTGNGEMAEALQAQAPYMQQMVKDIAARNGFASVYVLNRTGNALVSFGPMPAELVNRPEVLQRAAQGQGAVLPLRRDGARVVMDVLRPIKAPTQEGTDAAMVGSLWVSVPVGAKLTELVARTPLDRVGERTALLQEEGGKLSVVGPASTVPLAMGLDNLLAELHSGKTIAPSVVDASRTFADVRPIAGTPFAVLQEYRAHDALALMDVYRPGLYLITLLAVGVLAALMLALTLHLMAQRNRTRVALLGQTMDALVRMVEARDPYLAGHHDKLARLTLQLANNLHFKVGERATLFYAAKLSAVGRLLVPRELLAKKGKLSDAERAELEGHISRAQSVLGEVAFDLPVVAVIQQMYERVDGSGYPHGLKGDEIHRMARLLGAADAYMALTSARAHREAMGKEMALETMSHSKHFDLGMLAALRRVVGAA
ncbi:MAG: hypothetical protein H6922_00970 [Pseudomonadaceae bacterium]|nr:hypothetical protein [Pseudomonadaceae bacterium]